MYKIFKIKVNTSQKFPLLIAGLLSSENRLLLTGIKERLSTRFKKIKFSNSNLKNLYNLDYHLAKSLSMVVQDIDEILVLGATINIPNISGPAGGVIGKPNSEHSSSVSELEQLAKDLFMLTFPGGPGVVFNCNQEKLSSFIKHIKVKKGWPDIPLLIKGLKKNNISLLLSITDGTGSEFPGAIITYKNDNMKITCLS